MTSHDAIALDVDDLEQIDYDTLAHDVVLRAERDHLAATISGLQQAGADAHAGGATVMRLDTIRALLAGTFLPARSSR